MTVSEVNIRKLRKVGKLRLGYSVLAQVDFHPHRPRLRSDDVYVGC